MIEAERLQLDFYISGENYKTYSLEAKKKKTFISDKCLNKCKFEIIILKK